MPCRRLGTSNGEAPPAIPGRGEIWHLNFDPSTGREMLGEHYQVRTLDWQVRRATFKEKAPDEIVQQVLDCVGALLEE
ncbi:hypothetical protein [Azotobacter beijerinckii]|uniref:hypothetical protein n=1 Tax=Azotobacter beijerinckii TaxID=170623 RepID=UPI0029535B36|nr:hypothetical protein [Azotobacter beijerinckii]MDV7213051.1 hypothetical protein [Azotobacter beijerinckii]